MRRRTLMLGLGGIASGFACGDEDSFARWNRDRFAAAVRDMFDAPSTVEIFSIDPSDETSSEGNQFRGRTIIGTAFVAPWDVRQDLLNLIARGVYASEGGAFVCFQPRHALTIGKGRRSLDILICYSCLQLFVYGGGDIGNKPLLTSSSVEPAVTAIFESHGLTIAA
ncbi:MAG: hypothetical protein HOW73_29685 [Polyangiaceae bacterium]|nr:hypothetical protein [Polyangiaceae bacterium]